MSGHRPFGELTKDFPPQRRRRIEAIKGELLAQMPLHEPKGSRDRPSASDASRTVIH